MVVPIPWPVYLITSFYQYQKSILEKRSKLESKTRVCSCVKISRPLFNETIAMESNT
jgi:hypothetical protein